MAYRDSKKKPSFIRSVGYAVEGIRYSLQERNIKIHFCISIFVILAGFFFAISLVEWLFVITCIAGMISIEMVNTAIEKVVDLVTSDYHELAKGAKDLSAGAVLIYSIYSIFVGIVIFLPKVLNILVLLVK